MTLQPHSLAKSGSDFTAHPQVRDCYLWHEAWHPLHSACIYAVFSTTGSVHLIDAEANRCFQSWSQDELHGPATPPSLAQGAATSSADECDHEDPADWFDDEDDGCCPYLLSWSKDGCRLAVASCASASYRARCSVLHFSKSFG